MYCSLFFIEFMYYRVYQDNESILAGGFHEISVQTWLKHKNLIYFIFIFFYFFLLHLQEIPFIKDKYTKV